MPWNFAEIIVKTCGICQIGSCFKIMLKYPIEINITDKIFVKRYSMVQVKIGAFPLIRLLQKTYLQLSQTMCMPYAILYIFLLIYFICIIQIIILYYIYALNNLYISIPISWAVLQHNVQQQLPVCKQLYIRRQQVIKPLPTAAEIVLNGHKFWLIQSTHTHTHKRIPIL